MTHLSFSPREHQALCHVCRPLNLKRCRPAALKRLLVASLSASFPELAGRIARMRRAQFLILSDHFRRGEGHGLTGERANHRPG